MQKSIHSPITLSSCIILVVVCTQSVRADMAVAQNREPIRPISQTITLDNKKVRLGEKLFSDVRLSKNNSMACSHCHQLHQGGDDGLAYSITNSGDQDLINAPTVFNVGFNFRQTWRGEFKNLVQQAKADINNPRHGNISIDEVVSKRLTDVEYTAQFSQAFVDGLNEENLLKALAEYERSLITPNARFDQYLRGNTSAISEKEKQGYRLFKSYGCVACHQGVNVGGNMFQKTGVMNSFFDESSQHSAADLGRYKTTNTESDKHVFKVPGLRNVAVTAPYFHDGSAKDLEQAIQVMARVQLGLNMAQADVEKIAAFLHTLTGEYQGKLLIDQTP